MCNIYTIKVYIIVSILKKSIETPNLITYDPSTNSAITWWSSSQWYSWKWGRWATSFTRRKSFKFMVGLFSRQADGQCCEGSLILRWATRYHTPSPHWLCKRNCGISKIPLSLDMSSKADLLSSCSGQRSDPPPEMITGVIVALSWTTANSCDDNIDRIASNHWLAIPMQDRIWSVFRRSRMCTFILACDWKCLKCAWFNVL